MKTSSKRTRRIFSERDDFLLMIAVRCHPHSSWVQISSFVPGRTARQCRERWVNYLAPDVCQLPWSAEEDQQLLEFIEKNGKKWSQMLPLFPSRSYSNVKNRWYSVLKNQKRSQIIEPPEKNISDPELILEDQFIWEKMHLLSEKEECVSLF